jgi:hypothetical protein
MWSRANTTIFGMISLDFGTIKSSGFHRTPDDWLRGPILKLAF